MFTAVQNPETVGAIAVLSNVARSECNTERKPNLAMPIGLKSDMQQLGNTGKSAFDYVTRRFNASSAGLKKFVGLHLR
jgi:hypothetical protein